MSVYARPGSEYNPKSPQLHLLRLPDLSCNVSEMQTVIQTAWSRLLQVCTSNTRTSEERSIDDNGTSWTSTLFYWGINFRLRKSVT